MSTLFDADEFTVTKGAYGIVTPLRRLARRDDPQTSKAAAKVAHPSSGTLRAMVLTLLRASGDTGLTHEELIRAVRSSHPTYAESGIRTRTKELVDADLAFDSGMRRRTDRGLSSIVWQAAPAASGATLPPGSAGGSTPEDAA